MTLEEAKEKASELFKDYKIEKAIEYDNSVYFFYAPVFTYVEGSPSPIVSIDKNLGKIQYPLFYMLPDEVISEYRLNSSSENGR